MKELQEAITNLETVAFAVLGILAVGHWRRRGGPAAGWLAITFADLAFVAIAGIFLPEEIEGTLLTWITKVLLALLIPFPFLLYKFMSTFEPQPRWMDRTFNVLTVIAVAWSLTFRSLPGPDDPLTPSLVAFLALITVYWAALLSRVSIRLWKGGRGQPGVARRRMRVLSLGSAGLALGLLISSTAQSSSDEGSIASIAVALIALATAPLFMLGFAPPRVVRLAWRREEEKALRAAVRELMQATDPARIAEMLLPSMCTLIGGDRATMRDAQGKVIGSYRLAQNGTSPPDGGAEQSTIRVSISAGEISVRASRYTPFFGREEEEILQSLGDLADLAMAKAEIFGAEQRKNSFLSILQQVTSSVNASESLSDSLQGALDIVCTKLGWTAGHAYLAGRDPNSMESAKTWHLEDPAGFEDFRKITESAGLAAGDGAVGKVLTTGESIWAREALIESDSLRRDYLPVRGASASVPIRVGDSVVGVLEFFSADPRDPDEEVLGIMSQIAVQLGRAVERTRSREELSMRADDFARSNSDLEQFAYVASHDLQEPLRMVSSYVQLLSEEYAGAFDETGKRYMNYAVDGATRMQALVRDLLSFSRVGSRTSAFERTGLETALEKALSDLRMAIEESGTTIVHDPLPTVVGDSAQLKQLFQNLVGNAIKFRAEAPPMIVVGAESRPGDCLITIKDNGVGFEQKYAERAFIIFKRLHSRDAYPGTGIGLAISKKIVERHGGRIWVESEPGRGTTIFFTLPREDPAK